MFLYLYEKETGNYYSSVSGEDSFDTFTTHYSEDLKNKLSSIYVDEMPSNVNEYKVVAGSLIKKTEEEMKETREEGKILTSEERELLKLVPSFREQIEAEMTIAVLNILMEVL